MARDIPASARRSRRGLLAATLLMLAWALATPAPAAEEQPLDRSKPVSLYNVSFEWKLLYRSRAWGRTVAVDQWSGGELQFTAAPTSGGATRFSLVDIVETPWVFRWYPTKKDLKLGFAEAVREPSGHPFGALESVASTRARELHQQWIGGEQVDRREAAPSWQTSADRFWKSCRDQRSERPTLSEPPVFPFHVLGPLASRASFRRDARLAIQDESIREQLTTPWLPNGWQQAAAGREVAGYGAWIADRPKWEPRAIEGLMQALALLDSPWLAADGAAPEQNGAWTWKQPLEQVAKLAGTLNPKASSRLDWSAGDIPGRVTLTRTAEGTRRTFDAPAFSVDDLGHVRLWRSALFDEQEQPLADEAQVFAEDDDCGTKVWLRIRYSLAAGPTAGS